VPVAGEVYVSDGDRCEVVAVEPHRVRACWTWAAGGSITAWVSAGLWGRRVGWTLQQRPLPGLGDDTVTPSPGELAAVGTTGV